MIDWGLLGRIAGGGFGTTIFVLLVLSLVPIVIGFILRKTVKTSVENKKGTTEVK